MKLQQKNEELITILTNFLNGVIDAKELQSFVWEIIDYFTDTESDKLPPEEDFENVFWYTIWQIQHLCTEDHIKDGTAQKELVETIAYLKGIKQIPSYCFGHRP